MTDRFDAIRKAIYVDRVNPDDRCTLCRAHNPDGRVFLGGIGWVPVCLNDCRDDLCAHCGYPLPDSGFHPACEIEMEAEYYQQEMEAEYDHHTR